LWRKYMIGAVFTVCVGIHPAFADYNAHYSSQWTLFHHFVLVHTTYILYVYIRWVNHNGVALGGTLEGAPLVAPQDVTESSSFRGAFIIWECIPFSASESGAESWILI
jgi:hypothetical protein